MAYIGKLKLWLDDVLDAIVGLSVNGRTITYTKNDGSTGTITTQDTTYNDATTTTSGLMSARDKAKLDELSSSNIGVATSSSDGLMSATDKARHDEMSDAIDSYAYEEIPSDCLTLFCENAQSSIAQSFNIDAFVKYNGSGSLRAHDIALAEFKACKQNNICYLYLYLEYSVTFVLPTYATMCIGQLSIHPPIPIYTSITARTGVPLQAFIDEEGKLYLKAGSAPLTLQNQWNTQTTAQIPIDLVFPIDQTNN